MKWYEGIEIHQKYFVESAAGPDEQHQGMKCLDVAAAAFFTGFGEEIATFRYLLDDVVVEDHFVGLLIRQPRLVLRAEQRAVLGTEGRPLWVRAGGFVAVVIHPLVEPFDGDHDLAAWVFPE